MKNCNKIFILFLNLLLIVGNFTSCKKSSFGDTPSVVSLYKITEDDRNFALFRAAIKGAGLTEMFEGNSEITVIAPTNQAFKDLGTAYSTEINISFISKAILIPLVKNHIISGKLDLSTISGSKEITTLNKKITLQKVGDSYYADGADITKINMNATNGYMNVSNKVLINENPDILTAMTIITPNTLIPANNASLTFLAAAITKASTGSVNFTALLSGPGPYTLFAPSNNAFIDAGLTTVASVTALPAETLVTLLKNHILVGRKLTSDLDSVPINTMAGTPAYFDRVRNSKDVQVISTTNYIDGIALGFNSSATAVTALGGNINNIAGNGVYHIVSRFLPGSYTANGPIATNTLDYINNSTLNPDLTLLKAAIARAGLTSLFNDPLNSNTIFAPTDAAFSAAGYSNVSEINAIPIPDLVNLLKYHLVKRRINSVNIVTNNALNTLFTTKSLTSGLDVPGVITGNRTSTTYTMTGTASATAGTITTRDVVTTTGLVNKIGMVLKP